MATHPSGRWRVATHAGNRAAQLESTLAATPAQRLAWLEAVLRLVRQPGDEHPQGDPPGRPSPDRTA